jgi:DNA-directed RNA polymerase specialized sigma24 family protein
VIGDVTVLANPSLHETRRGSHGGSVAEPTPAVASPDDSFEPCLGPAIARLSEAERCAVVLVVGFGYTLREAADVIGVTALGGDRFAGR